VICSYAFHSYSRLIEKQFSNQEHLGSVEYNKIISRIGFQITMSSLWAVAMAAVLIVVPNIWINFLMGLSYYGNSSLWMYMKLRLDRTVLESKATTSPTGAGTRPSAAKNSSDKEQPEPVESRKSTEV